MRPPQGLNRLRKNRRERKKLTAGAEARTFVERLKARVNSCPSQNLREPDFSRSLDDPVNRIDPSGREALVEVAFNYQQVALRVLAAGTIYYLARALSQELDCVAAKAKCITQCTEDVLMQPGPPTDKSGPFFECMHRCMEAAGCE